MDARIAEIEEKKITREEMKEKERLENETERLKVVQRARQGNVEMALLLQKEMSTKEKRREDLLNQITGALKLVERGKEEFSKMKEVFIYVFFYFYTLP